MQSVRRACGTWDFTRRDLFPVSRVPYEDPRTVVPDRDRAQENSHRLVHHPRAHTEALIPPRTSRHVDPSRNPTSVQRTPHRRHPQDEDDRSADTPFRRSENGDNVRSIPRDRRRFPTTTPGLVSRNSSTRAKRANPAVGLEAGGGVRRQVGHTGFEPVTSCVSYKRASQLRQWPEFPPKRGWTE